MTGGTIVSWNDSFEKGRNDDLAKLYPEHKAFLESLNMRMFDLGKEVFGSGLYSNPRIDGWSLKKVQPELAPEMSYDELAIGEGGDASARWYLDVFLGSDEKDEVYEALLRYCEQDTLVMEKILQVIRRMVGE